MPKSISVRELGDAMSTSNAPQVIDVRRKPVFDASEHMIAGATWHNPEEIETWLFGLDPSREVVVYCMHGHQVSQGCADRLEKAGFRAAYLDGGFEHWTAEGYQTAAKP